MKKITLILLSVLLSVGAWAETAVLATSTMTGQKSGAVGPAGTSTADNNVMVGKADGIGTGWELQCNKLDKGCNGSQTITVGESNYTSLKNSNGAKHTVKVPDGYVATSVTFYAVSNYTIGSAVDANNPSKGTYGTPKLSEFNGVTCADEIADKGATPTAITKLLGYATSFTFTFSVTQVNYLAVVTYQEDVTKYTFGTTRDAADGQVTSNNYMLDPGCSDVTTSSLISTYGTLNTDYKFYNGTSTQLTFGANATESYRNLANSVTIKSQAGDNTTDDKGTVSGGAENNNAYVAFDLTIAQNKRLNILSIASAVYPGEKSNYGFEYIVEDADGNQLYKSPSALNISNPKAANDYLDYSANVGAVSALRNLSGKVRVKFLWWCNSSSTVLILKDFNVTATLDEVSETGKEYTLKEVKINDVTYDYINNGPTVSESYATLPSVKFIYSVKKVWSDGVKTDTEDEEEVVTPTLVGDNQVAATTKLAEAFTLTFTNVAQFPVVPNAAGTYIDLSQATGTSFNIENNGANIGSTNANTVMNLDLINTTAGNYLLQFLSGAKGLIATVDINVKGSDYDETQSFNIANTGNWNLKEFHAMVLKDLPAGNLTLKLTVTSTSGSYAGNYGNFAIYALSSYNQCDGTNFDLTKGTYTGGARYEADNQNVGNIKNGASAEYTMYNATEGVATLHMGLKRYGDGTVTVTVKDTLTGTTELTTSFVTTADFCKGYDTPSDIQLGQLTTGLKSIRFDFANESGYICNYKNVNVTIAQPEPESMWQDISIDLAANAPLGLAAGAKYLTIADETYTYVDDEPVLYNAYLSSTGWNGAQHGYNNLTMAVPVEVGIYKITFGGCNFGSENRGKVTDAEGNTFNVINANGKTITTIDNKVGCSNTVSVWYEAASAMVLKAIMNNYIPSIAIEKVSSVPENRNIITYSLGEGVLGQAPDDAVADGNSYTLPAKNYTVYKEGYTLIGWNDGTANHNLGETFTVDDDITLTPVFRQNTKTLADRTEAIVLKWDAQSQNGCPTYNYNGNNLDLYFVTQATVAGEVIDVAEKVTTASSNGCFRNGNWTNWCQVNGTAIFVLPSCKDAIVTFESYSASVNSTIDGVALIGNTSKTPSATITDEDATVTVEYAADASYFRYMQVTLPKQVVLSDDMTAEAMDELDGFTGDVTINRALAAGMYNTICLPFEMTAAEISEKLGTCTIQELNSATLNDNELVLNFTEVAAIVAGKAYLIQPSDAVSGWTMENVTLSTTTDPTVGTSADFIGVLTPTQLTASENTLCVGAGNTLFYVSATSTMKGLRAYFQVKGAAAGAPARISLGGHVATGLENDNDNANVNKLIEQGRVIIRIDGHDYDLNGRLLK